MSGSRTELNEPVIDFFKKANIAAVHRVLERAEKNAQKASRQSTRHVKSLRKPGFLAKTLNKAMAAYGRSRPNQPSIRQKAPDTGGRPYHFGFSTVTKGGGKAGGAGQPGTTQSTGRSSGGAASARGASGAQAATGRPKANTKEAAHQVYAERTTRWTGTPSRSRTRGR